VRVFRRPHGIRRPQELLVLRVAPERLYAEATVGLHHRGVVVYDEIYLDLWLVALAEAAHHQVRNPEDLGGLSRVGGPAR
jgi:hypothetical protein